MAELDKKHKEVLTRTSDKTEIKEENYVHKNRVSNEKLELEKKSTRGSKTENMRHIAINII